MDVRDLLEELFGRIPEHVRVAVDGLSADDLVSAPGAGRNPIGWLVWHLARVQDHHVAELLGREQVWTTAPWPARFGLDADPDDTGYGHSPEQVAGVTEADLDRVVDRRWDPPVTLGVRLVSVADDDIQHAGQAAYVRGLLGR